MILMTVLRISSVQTIMWRGFLIVMVKHKLNVPAMLNEFHFMLMISRVSQAAEREWRDAWKSKNISKQHQAADEAACGCWACLFHLCGHRGGRIRNMCASS